MTQIIETLNPYEVYMGPVFICKLIPEVKGYSVYELIGQTLDGLYWHQWPHRFETLEDARQALESTEQITRFEEMQ